MEKSSKWVSGTVVLMFIVGFVIGAMAMDAHGATSAPSCDGKTRILCGVEKPGLKVPAKKVRPAYRAPVSSRG